MRERRERRCAKERGGGEIKRGAGERREGVAEREGR